MAHCVLLSFFLMARGEASAGNPPAANEDAERLLGTWEMRGKQHEKVCVLRLRLRACGASRLSVLCPLKNPIPSSFGLVDWEGPVIEVFNPVSLNGVSFKPLGVKGRGVLTIGDCVAFSTGAADLPYEIKGDVLVIKAARVKTTLEWMPELDLSGEWRRKELPPEAP